MYYRLALRPCFLMQLYTEVWDFHVECASVAAWAVQEEGRKRGVWCSLRWREGELHSYGDGCFLRLAFSFLAWGFPPITQAGLSVVSQS